MSLQRGANGDEVDFIVCDDWYVLAWDGSLYGSRIEAVEYAAYLLNPAT